MRSGSCAHSGAMGWSGTLPKRKPGDTLPSSLARLQGPQGLSLGNDCWLVGQVTAHLGKPPPSQSPWDTYWVPVLWP